MEEIIELKQLEDSEVNEARVKNARTRPSSTGLYGEKNLSSTEVKEIFDKYPDLLRGKLEEVIDFANALLEIIGNGVEGATITGALNSLSGRVGGDDFDEDSRLEGKTLASAILKLSDDLKESESSISDHKERIEGVEDGLSTISITYDATEEKITFTDSKGNKKEIDLPIESLVTGARLDGDDLVLELEGGTEVRVSMEKIADAISSVAGSVIPADDTHIYSEGSYIVFKDTNGKTVKVRSFNADSYFGDIGEALDAILENQNSLIFNQILDDIIEEQEEVLAEVTE